MSKNLFFKVGFYSLLFPISILFTFSIEIEKKVIYFVIVISFTFLNRKNRKRENKTNNTPKKKVIKTQINNFLIILQK